MLNPLHTFLSGFPHFPAAMLRCFRSGFPHTHAAMLRCFRSGFPHTHAAIHMRFQVSIVHTIELSLGFQTPNLRGSRKSGCCGVQDHDVTWLPGALHKPNPTAEANSPKNFLSGNSREMVEIAQLLAGSRSIPASTRERCARTSARSKAGDQVARRATFRRLFFPLDGCPAPSLNLLPFDNARLKALSESGGFINLPVESHWT